jgi:AcrR family transcriptional regulator
LILLARWNGDGTGRAPYPGTMRGDPNPPSTTGHAHSGLGTGRGLGVRPGLAAEPGTVAQSGLPAESGVVAEPGVVAESATAAEVVPSVVGGPDDETFRPLWLRPAPAERATPAERAAPLNREAIVAAAIALADAENIKAVSIRRVAAALEARPMSLYSHIGRKQDLIDLMVDEAVGASLVPGALPPDWRDALTMIAYHLRDGVRRHPWVLSVVGRSSALSPNALRSYEQGLGAVADLDLDRDRKIAILAAIDTFAIGQVVRELAGLPASEADEPPDAPAGARRSMLASLAGPDRRQHPGRSESWLRAAESYLHGLVGTGEYPRIEAFGVDAVLAAHGGDADAADRRFRDGLTFLLDGIEASMRARPS